MPNYALIQAIFIGSVSAYVIVLALIGPEKHGSHFEKGKTAFQAGASKEDVNLTPVEIEGVQGFERSSMGSGGEKGATELVEDKTPGGDNSV